MRDSLVVTVMWIVVLVMGLAVGSNLVVWGRGAATAYLSAAVASFYEQLEELQRAEDYNYATGNAEGVDGLTGYLEEVING